MRVSLFFLLTLITASSLQGFSDGFQCGLLAGDKECPDNLCCSRYSWCGSSAEYCGQGCQSGPCYSKISHIIPKDVFEEMLNHRSDSRCNGSFYTYDAFIEAAKSFPDFGTTGDDAMRRQEVAAFFGQTSQQTYGGGDDAPGGKFAWGYCFVEAKDTSDDHCVPSKDWPCAAGKKYYGRGPIQLSDNYNYKAAGEAIGVDLLSDPDMVASDPVIAFKTAFWFWMSPGVFADDKYTYSPHTAILNVQFPARRSVADHTGYGLVTSLVNGDEECGRGFNLQASQRIGFYQRYCELLKVSMGDHLDCYSDDWALRAQNATNLRSPGAASSVPSSGKVNSSYSPM